MTEHVLEGAASADHLSFYGLVYWLDECDKLLERADYALLAKKVSSEDQAAGDGINSHGRLRKCSLDTLDDSVPDSTDLPRSCISVGSLPLICMVSSPCDLGEMTCSTARARSMRMTRVL